MRGEIRAFLRQQPRLTVREVAADVLRDKTPDDPWARPVVMEAVQIASGDPERMWAYIEQHDPATAEAILSAELAPEVLDVAREDLKP
jgi:hypothetical protein